MLRKAFVAREFPPKMSREAELLIAGAAREKKEISSALRNVGPFTSAGITPSGITATEKYWFGGSLMLAPSGKTGTVITAASIMM